MWSLLSVYELLGWDKDEDENGFKFDPKGMLSSYCACPHLFLLNWGGNFGKKTPLLPHQFEH